MSEYPCFVCKKRQTCIKDCNYLKDYKKHLKKGGDKGEAFRRYNQNRRNKD